MNIKVDAVSKFGMKVDNKWVGYDRKFKPIEVRKGDLLDIELNDEGFIIKASLIEKESVSKQVVREASVDYRQREILKGQCLNIVASKLDGNIASADYRKDLIAITTVLFAELQDAGYLIW